MIRTIVTRAIVAGMTSLAIVGAAGAAWANTIHFEAESVRDRARGTITSPLLIKDDPLASGGSFVTVAAGTSSPSNAPARSQAGAIPAASPRRGGAPEMTT